MDCRQSLHNCLRTVMGVTLCLMIVTAAPASQTVLDKIDPRLDLFTSEQTLALLHFLRSVLDERMRDSTRTEIRQEQTSKSSRSRFGTLRTEKFITQQKRICAAVDLLMVFDLMTAQHTEADYSCHPYGPHDPAKEILRELLKQYFHIKIPGIAGLDNVDMITSTLDRSRSMSRSRQGPIMSSGFNFNQLRALMAKAG